MFHANTVSFKMHSVLLCIPLGVIVYQEAKQDGVRIGCRVYWESLLSFIFQSPAMDLIVISKLYFFAFLLYYSLKMYLQGIFSS